MVRKENDNKICKFNKYKSIGNYDESKIILKPIITAIVGKNESGKSNVLDGMSKIDLCKKNSKAFYEENNNRIFSSEGDLSYKVVLTKGRKDNLEILTDTEVLTHREQEIPDLYRWGMNCGIHGVFFFL